MASSSTSTAPAAGTWDLYLMKSKSGGDRYPHWYLVTVPSGVPLTNPIKGTRYHSRDGPTATPPKPYRVAVESDAPVRSQNWAAEIVIQRGLSDKDKNKIKTAAHKITAQQCQKYVICLLALLEQQRVITPGHAERHARDVQMSDRVRAYEGQHLQGLADPVGIRLPSSWPRGSPGPSPAGSQHGHGSGGGTGTGTGTGHGTGHGGTGGTGNNRRKKGGCCIIM